MRGKARSNVEFGANVSISVTGEGFAFLDQLSCDPCHSIRLSCLLVVFLLMLVVKLKVGGLSVGYPPESSFIISARMQVRRCCLCSVLRMARS